MSGIGNFDRKTLVGYSLLGLLLASLIFAIIAYWGNFPVWFWFFLVILISIVIWKACEPFSDASFFLGRNIPGSVRGATIDAVASSMPEFFTVMFFLFFFGTYESGIATCAGSAIYNMIVIPAVCVFFIYNVRKLKGLDTNLVVEKEVLYRDGLYFLFSEIVLISFITTGELTWWMGLVFLGLYGGYALWLWMDAKRHMRVLKENERVAIDRITKDLYRVVHTKDYEELLKIWPDFPDSDMAEELEEDPDEFWQCLQDHMPEQEGIDGCRLDGCSVVLRAQGADEFTVDYIGTKHSGMLRLNIDEKDDKWFIHDGVKYEHTKSMAWLIILATTAIIGGACYFLTLSCKEISVSLDIKPFFVAVVIAAAATSVPDTFLSMLSARKGDDSGAVSNAFGSNIFDINICLGLPLLIYGLWKGTVNLENSEGVQEVRIILLVLSTITLIILAIKMKLTRAKAVILLGMYALFLTYAILRGWAGLSLAEMFGSLAELFGF